MRSLVCFLIAAFFINDVYASYVACEINFNKKQVDLSPSAKIKLQSILNDPNRNKIKRVKVVTWGDITYPSIHNKMIFEEEKDLVVRRNISLLHFFEKFIPEAQVHLLNMAEKEASLKEHFADEDLATKKALEEMAGILNVDTTVKVPGKASKSIVIFIMEE